MAERRTFRRKKRPEDGAPQGVLPSRLPEHVAARDADQAPIAPLETRDARLTRRAAEAREAARRAAELEAKKRADRESLAQADAQRQAAARLQERRRAAATARAAADSPRGTNPEPGQNAQGTATRRDARPQDGSDRDDPPAPHRLGTPAVARPTDAPRDLSQDWADLGEFHLDEKLLEQHRVITASRRDPAHAAFDVLRTRILQALAEKGWSRVAITSPTKNCGKTFAAANLAISLARQENCRTLLVDLDLRAPSLNKVFGVSAPGRIGDVLRGEVAATDRLLRPGANRLHVGRNIAFGFNDTPEDYPAELLQAPATATALAKMQQTLQPDVVLYDMPPALVSDDVIAFRAQFDAALLVIGGGLTTQSEVKEVERRLGTQTPLLGMILNKADGEAARKYMY